MEFGERVMYLKSGTKGTNKMDSRWGIGIWLGMGDESRESIIGTNEGCIKTNEVRRMGQDSERWSKEEIDEMKGVAWEPRPGASDLRIEVTVKVHQERIMHHEEEERRKLVPRRFRIHKKDFSESGLAPL